MPTTVHSTNSQTRPHLLLLLLLLLLLQGHQLLLLTEMLLPHLDIGHLAHVGPLVLGGGPRPHLTVARHATHASGGRLHARSSAHLGLHSVKIKTVWCQ